MHEDGNALAGGDIWGRQKSMHVGDLDRRVGRVPRLLEEHDGRIDIVYPVHKLLSLHVGDEAAHII